MNIRLWLLQKFFKWFFKIKPLEAVKYYKKHDSARAKVVQMKDGSRQMFIEGEKYPFPGFPRAHILMGGSLDKMKDSLKESIFHSIFAVVEQAFPDMIPEEQLCPFVKELWRVLTLLEEAEMTEDMRLRIRNGKKAICYFLQEDDSYRFRFQWLLERLNMKKCRLSKADKYYFRAKYFKADYKDEKSIINKARNSALY